MTRSTNPAVQAEGYWGLRQYHPAFDAFEAAVKARPKDVNLLVRYGRFLFEAPMGKPNDGSDEFEAALKIDKANAQALLGLAMVAAENYGAAAVKYANQALESDPKLYEAREVLARVALEDNNPAKAREEANKAVAISPEALDAMAILATADWLDDKPAPAPKGSILTASPWIDKIFKVNPHYGEAYATAGHFFVINRMYEEGILYYRKALEVEPSLLSAKSELGISLMRLARKPKPNGFCWRRWKCRLPGSSHAKHAQPDDQLQVFRHC